MTSEQRIREKLVELTSYIDDLLRLQTLSWTDFQTNVMLRRGIERTLQVAAECALDVGNMVIAQNQWRAPESNRDVFQVLAEHEVLPGTLLGSFLKMASFRNILVHEYTRVDPAIVFALLRKMPQDLLLFRDQIVARL
ncbi:MAG: DUF86 domain-containing protein [Bacillota bacterium]